MRPAPRRRSRIHRHRCQRVLVGRGRGGPWMEGESVLVEPTACGRRRHKALAPWRFQRDFVRRHKAGDGFDAKGDAKCRGLETPESSGEATAGIGISGSESDGGSGNRELDRYATASDGSGDNSKGSGCRCAGRDRNSERLNGDAAAKESNIFPKDCNLEEGLDSNGVTREPNGAAKPSNLQGFQCNVPAEESNSAAKDCNSEGFRTSGDALTGCRKGRKAMAPWRFQVGYKRSSSQGSCSSTGTDGRHGTTTSKFRDGSRQCAPATGHNCSRVRVSATSNHSSAKVQKEIASVPKKREIDEDDHHQVMRNNRVAVPRESVMASLREFRIIYRKLLKEEETKWKERGHGLRPDLAALKIFRERLCVEYDDRSYVGSVPGIHVGDAFNSSMEICIVGLHRQQLMCVDYIKRKDGTCLAVSIVSYAKPSSFNNNLDFLLHVGSMASTSDQKIEGTDLALKQSMDTNTPIRVIHVLGENSQPKELTNYVYGGLYLVQKFCREKVRDDRYIHTFHLRRMARQPHIDIQESAKTRMPEPFDGIFMADISKGLEKIPISVINSISNEYPVPFRYISQIQYPPKYQPDPPSGCDCVDGCSNSQKCACAVKNGRVIPFNDNGAIIDEKPLIYECGPSCKCPPTCHNRVSQHGIKFRLQVFKTKSMGWGVRSLDFIPSGSFVCEYIGELLEDDEAQERKNDEYLFAIGNNYYDISRWEGISKTIPSLQNGPSDDEEIGFAVNALNCGNLARFINHSCTPNLFAQNVLYDHDNKSMPHIMLFAGENVPPLRELSYDYNYTIDEVYDSDGNIKKKQCFCGSIECTGWLY